jgi:uncharacterized protein (TIGR03437 family)
MARAVLSKFCAVAFSRSNCAPFGGSTLKRILSISHLILPLLALASANCLSAQTLVVDKATLTFSGQFGGSAVTQTVNVTSTGTSIPFILVAPPGSSWLKVSGQGVAANTPAAVTVTADPTGLSAGTYSANIAVIGGSATNPSIAVTFTVSAIGVNPASLAFTYTAGSIVFPSPQSLTLSGAATQCTATVANASGGSWFTLLQSSCASPGSLTVLINNGVVAGLAPNTYSGTITITPVPAGQSPAVVVPMTLTVVPTPPVTVNPPSLVFNWQTGIAAPNPSQTFTVSTTASQPLNYSFTATVDTGSWISTINPPSGSISPTTGTAQITLTVNPNGLAVNTYNGKLTLLTPGGSPAQQDIPVKLVISNTQLLNVPNATLNFAYQLGTNAPAAQTVNISATSGILAYAVTQSANSAWLSVPNAGSTATPLTVSVNPAGLTPGTYTATVNVVSATQGSSAQQIPVVLKVTNDPTVSTSVSQLSFPYQIGQSAPASQSVRVTSSTGVPLNYSAALSTTNCGAAWLLLNGANNSINGVTDDTLTVSVATAGLVAGTCAGKITITATNPATGAAAVNSPLTVNVTLYVSSSALLVLAPANPPVFTVGVGTQSPAPQNISLTSTNSDVLNYTVAFQSNNGGNWLFVGPLSGSTTVNNILTVSVIPTGLAAAVYSGTVTVAASGPGGAVVANSPITIPVTLNVTAGSLTGIPSDLSFEQTLGGPAPAAQTVTIGSSGQTLNYTAVANSNTSVNWLSISPASGNTSTSGVLSVAVDGSRLTPGVTYLGTIIVTSPGAGNSPASINVHFKVDPGTLSAPTTTLTFTQVAGSAATPPAQSIAVTGSPAPLNFTVASSTQNGVNWLRATPASGTTPSTVQVLADGTVLAVGQYIGTVTIASAGANGSPIAVQVVLNVVPPAVLAASPTSLSFAYIAGQATPPAQNLVVNASGTNGTVPFTVQVQFDGTAGQWLIVSPTSSNAPATLSVSVSPSTLAAGNYTGHVIITSPNALVSATIPVTLVVTAIPQPVISAVANAANYSTGAVSPGENIVIFGTGVGPATLVKGTVVNNAFPTLAGATRVLFDNTPAPIIYASATQTSVMVPYGVFGRTTTNIVVEFSGVPSVALTYNVALAAPGIYTLNAQGTGPGSILNQDGVTVNGITTPELRGNIIAIYMTGEGQTTPQGVDGAIIPAVVSALKKPNLPVTVTIGGVDAPVAYAGSAPSLVSGVMQVNVTIPLTAPTGTQPVVVTVGTAKSQSTATVVVQ